MEPKEGLDPESPRLDRIVLSSGDELITPAGSVLVIVGPNNSGKTYMLRTILSAAFGREFKGAPTSSDLVSRIDFANTPLMDDHRSIIEDRIKLSYSDEGRYYLRDRHHPHGATISAVDIERLLHNPQPDSLGPLADLFISIDDPADRIEETEHKAVDPSNRAPFRVEQARRSPKRTDVLRDLFFKIFPGSTFFFHEWEGQLGLALGTGSNDVQSATEAFTDEYQQAMQSAKKLHDQGLGMRSAMGLLLRLVINQRELLVSDEPDAFLHPAQASALGEVLASQASAEGMRMVLATHNRHLVAGLLAGGGANVTMVRLDRDGGVSRAEVIASSAFSSVRDESLIQHTHVLEALFVRFVILVESETDALFYRAAMASFLGAVDEHGSSDISIHDFSVIGIGGKANFRRMRRLVAGLNPRVVLIGDRDLLYRIDHWQEFLDDAEDAAREASQLFNDVEELIPGCKSKDNKWEKELKKRDKGNEADEAVCEALNSIAEVLEERGVFTLPDGELEDFDRELYDPHRKRAWARAAIEAGVHEHEAAQSLMGRIFESLTTARDSQR